MRRINLDHGKEIVSRLPAGPCVGVEIGVADGQLSDYLGKSRAGLTLYMVDPYGPLETYRHHCRHIGDVNGSKSMQCVYADRMAAAQVAARHNFVQVEVESTEAANSLRVPDKVDFVFVDGDHSRAATLADCRAWLPHVKPGGWIGGHDYDRFSDDGVRSAVVEFANESGLCIETGKGWTWFCRVEATHA